LSLVRLFLAPPDAITVTTGRWSVVLSSSTLEVACGKPRVYTWSRRAVWARRASAWSRPLPGQLGPLPSRSLPSSRRSPPLPSGPPPSPGRLPPSPSRSPPLPGWSPPLPGRHLWSARVSLEGADTTSYRAALHTLVTKISDIFSDSYVVDPCEVLKLD
jgi:hypothetical protein